MNNKTFEQFLEEKHGKDYQGFDDDMSEDFENWLFIELEREDIIKYADEYAKAQRQETVKKIEGKYNNKIEKELKKL